MEATRIGNNMVAQRVQAATLRIGLQMRDRQDCIGLQPEIAQPCFSRYR